MKTEPHVVIITGASSGLGAALAVRYAQEGSTVVLVARREKRLREVALQVETAGGQALVIVADVSREEECNRIVDTVATVCGKIDVLLNNAGRGNRASVEDTPTEQWRSIFALNVDSVFWLTSRVLPIMKLANQGHIVAISSVAGKYGHPFNAAYVAAKHAVAGFIAAIRTELVGTNILASTVFPAGIITEWADATEGGSIGQLYAAAIPRSRTIAHHLGIGTAPLSRMITADECADGIVQALAQGRTADIYTHDGTHNIAIQAAEDRIAQEDRFEALWLAMKEKYYEGGSTT